MDKNFKYIKFSIVNFITFSRVIGSVVLPIIYFKYGIESLAFFVILLFLTDFVDGKLSRLWKVESFLGCFLDFTSDKLFAFVMLSILTYVYPFMLIVLFLEFIIFVINTLAFSENKNVQSSKMGKVKTFVLDVSVSILFLFTSKGIYENYIPLYLNRFISKCEYPISYILIGVIIGMEVLTISDYSKNRLRQTTYEGVGIQELKSFKELVYVLTSREFYINNKDKRIKSLIYKDK